MSGFTALKRTTSIYLPVKFILMVFLSTVIIKLLSQLNKIFFEPTNPCQKVFIVGKFVLSKLVTPNKLGSELNIICIS